MGSYEELVADKNGKYHELWRAQAQYYEADEMGQPDAYFRIWLSRFLKESVILYAYQLSRDIYIFMIRIIILPKALLVFSIRLIIY